ncbi:hypothetical protein [Salinibacterium sp. ZJ77]|uniref:hypothetical protein n=1 Tax=Salinibacterium sp. ZJ77 TaxID=2708337 RepID=UPI00141DC22A|nr:hypothetical protein [Salinibacterium sp. ZJ77]
MSRALRAGSVVAALAVALLGCASSSVGTKVDVAIPDDATMQQPYGPWAFVVDGDLHVGMSGSSTCPPTPTSLDADGDLLVVTIGMPTDQEICTNDLVPAIFELDIDDIPERVEFVYGDDRTTVDVVD